MRLIPFIEYRCFGIAAHTCGSHLMNAVTKGDWFNILFLCSLNVFQSCLLHHFNSIGSSCPNYGPFILSHLCIYKWYRYIPLIHFCFMKCYSILRIW